MKEKKSKYQKLQEKVSINKKNSWEIWKMDERKKAFDFADKYKLFLSKAKTEREAVEVCVNKIEKKGFKNIDKTEKLKPGDKIYYVQREKSLILGKIGKNKLKSGFNMVMGHVDSPHLDFKVPSLYEDESMAFMKTHYYGGIKKYQWTTIPLALHGIVYLENGKRIKINIGENSKDPVFVITDLLPHLDREKPGKPKREVKGEDLNLLVGTIPVKDEKVKEKVKLTILEHLNNKHKIKEEDLAAGELQAVPAGETRDVGFDRSLVGGFGHDDRSCSFAAFSALIDSKINKKTQIAVLIDREDTGSEGETGAKSYFIENFFSKLLEKLQEGNGIKDVYNVYSKSKAISGDTSPAIDPDYKDVYDLRTDRRIGQGVAIEKFVGAGGKYYTSDASSRYLYEIRSLLKKNKIHYQLGGSSGKIDLGGGGTIGVYLAKRNIEVVDMGIPCLNVHSPMEILSKADLYNTYRAYNVFLESNLQE